MGDSMFYDDEMLEEMGRLPVNEDNEKSAFLNDCKKINAIISGLSDKLNLDGIENLKIDAKLKEVVKLITTLNSKYDELSLADEEKEEVTEAIGAVKENFVELLNKHINRYNTKVDYINTRINDLTSRLNHVELTVEVNEIIINLDSVPRCDVVNNGDWRQLSYLDNLDYFKLEEQITNISLIEKKLKMKPMESVEIWGACNHIKLMIDDLKKEINDEMSLIEINLLLRKCRICYEQIVDVDVRHQLSINELSDKKNVSSYNGKITKFNNEIQKLETLLLEKKKNMKKPSVYKSFCYELDTLGLKYDVIIRKISEYQGKSNDRVVKRLNTSYLKKYQKMFLEIEERILEQKESLDIIQYSNLTKKMKKIKRKQDSINFDLNIAPIMLNGIDVGLDFETKMKDFDLKLEALDKKIQDLGENKLRIIKDHGVRKEIDKIIDERWSDIYNYDKLLSSYKKQSPEVYKALKSKLDERKNKFDKICKNYRGKCPLGVKQVKSAKHLYKKHRKEALVVAGLSTMVLLTGHSVIIPAIIQGNLMLGTTIPALSAYLSTVNGILGGMIGATKTSGNLWFLPSSGMFTPAHAVTSLLKGVAYSSLGNAALFSPVIASIVFGIKNLATKINSVEYKEKLKLSREIKQDKKTKKKQDKNSRIFDKFTVEEMGKLFYEYRKSNESLDDFANKHNLSQEEISALMYLENKSNERKNVGRRSR